QAGVGDVEVLALVAQAEVAADDRGGGRFQVVAADRGVDQQADLVRVDAGVGQRLHPGERRSVRGLHALVPQAAGVDAGDVLQHVGPDAEAVEGGLEPRVDLIAGQASRRIDVGEAGDGNVWEKHGLSAGLRTKGNPYYRVRPPPAFGRGRERSVPAAPGGELLVAVQRRAERADGVGADPGRL